MNILSKLKVLELSGLQIPFIYIISFNPEDSATLFIIFLFYKWKNWDSEIDLSKIMYLKSHRATVCILVFW